MVSDKGKVGLYLAVYFIALGILTWEVIRLYGEINQVFVETLLTNLINTGDVIDTITWVAVLAIVPVFFLWFFNIAFSAAPPEARKQLLLCIIPLAVFLLVGFWAILALIYMAVTFIGIYLSGVGTGLGGLEDGKKEGSIGKYVGLIGVVVGLVLEFANQGLFDVVLPLAQSLNLPFLSQEASPNPSGYGIGYYISMLSITYSVIKTVRESLSLRGDIVGSGSLGEGAGAVRFLMNPMFMVFWVLGAIFLWPLLPFILLNLGLGLLYIMGWVTGKAGWM